MINTARRVLRRAFSLGLALALAAMTVPVGLDAAGTAPTAPTGVSATPASNRVALSWNPNPEPDIAGYNVYREDVTAGPTVQDDRRR